MGRKKKGSVGAPMHMVKTPRKRAKPHQGVPKAGPLKITKADGTEEVVPAMTQREVERVLDKTLHRRGEFRQDH